MRTTEQRILEEYRKGDLAQRLTLYMTYRDLREEFTEIEQSTPAFAISEKPARCRTEKVRKASRERIGVEIPFFAGMRSRLRGWICG